MKRGPLLRLLLLSLTCANGLWAQQPEINIFLDQGELFTTDDQDYQLIREFLEESRDKPLSEKPNIRLSGDIRVRYRWRSERVDGRKITRSCNDNRLAPFPGANFSDDRYRVEANILLDYRTECTWGAMKLEYENELGKISGTESGVDCERALIGFNLYECGDIRWFVEAGRQHLSEKFDSEIQYGSRLDGIFTRFTAPIDRVGNLFFQAAGMVVDYRCDEYAWIAAVGVEDINCDGWYVKYSYIDWGKHRSDDRFPINLSNDLTVIALRPFLIRPFRISQGIIGRKIPCVFGGKTLNVYGGVLYNHAAQRLAITLNRKENLGWYLGFQLGKVVKRCDWAIKLEFDYCQAQAILESDNNGIGRGNSERRSIFESLIAANARGDTNYWGPAFVGAYAVTDQLTMRVQAVYSHSINDNIGGKVEFKEVELQAVYAF